MIIHGHTADFEKMMAEKKTFIVDFFATWCGPCKMLGAVLEKVENTLGVDVLKIDIDQDTALAEEYEVMVVPTLLFVKNGEIVYRESGFFPEGKFLSLVNEHLG